MDQMPQDGDGDVERRRVDLQAITNAMVKIHKDDFGRGPTKARSNMAGEDTLICTLEDTLTPAERKMAEAGEHQRLRDVRLYFQHASEDDSIGAVETITGRKVRGFVSGMDTHQDIATEVFYFEKPGDPAQPRDEELRPS